MLAEDAAIPEEKQGFYCKVGLCVRDMRVAVKVDILVLILARVSVVDVLRFECPVYRYTAAALLVFYNGLHRTVGFARGAHATIYR